MFFTRDYCRNRKKIGYKLKSILAKNLNYLKEINFDFSFKNISFIYCAFISIFCARNHFAIDDSITLVSLFNKDNYFFVDFVPGRSLIHHLGFILIKTGFTHYYLSLILLFFTNTIFWFSCANIIKNKIIDNKIIIFIILWFLTQVNMFAYINPSYEYPITYSPHLSTIASVLVLLCISTIINRDYKNSILISLINITIHPLLGMFSLLLAFIIILVNGKVKAVIIKFKSFEITFIIILYIFFILCFFYTQELKENFKNINLLTVLPDIDLVFSINQEWIIFHRNKIFSLSFYMPALFFILYLAVLSQKKKYVIFNNDFILFVLIFVLPLALAFFSQALLFYNILILDKFIPDRFLIFSNFIMRLFFFKLIILSFYQNNKIQLYVFFVLFLIWPAIYSFIYNGISVSEFNPFTKLNIINFLVLLILLFCKNILSYKFKSKQIIFLVTLSIVFLYLAGSKTLSSLSYFSNSKFTHHALIVENKICPNIKKGSGIVVSTYYQYNYLLRSCNIVPYSIPRIPDGVFYSPNKTYEIAQIYKIVYNIDLLKVNSQTQNNILKKFNNDIYKDVWENRNKKEWSELFKKLQVTHIVTPLNWKIKLDKVLTFQGNNIYKLL